MKRYFIAKITGILAREIIDSRGEPTVEVDLSLENGGRGLAQVESGASIGSYEAHDIRDGDMSRLKGKGVLRVVESINHVLAPELLNMEFPDQKIFDQFLIGLDGTPNLERYGANGILGLSIAFAQAVADQNKIPLYQIFGQGRRMPIPMFTIFNGGKLASFSTDVQEFNVLIKDAPSFAESLRAGAEIYHSVGQILDEQGLNKKIGDEGGYAVPGATTDQGMELIVEGAKRAGYSEGRIGIVIDEAANSLYTDQRRYHLLHHQQEDVESDYLIRKFESLKERFPLMGVEDGLADQDWEGWIELTKRLGDKIMIIGDDIFSTNAVRLTKGKESGVANAVMIKPSQIGTITGAIEATKTANDQNYTPVLSQRSGDTESAYLTHLAVGLGFPYVKFGAPARGERTVKYNELLRIEEGLNQVLENSH